MNREAFPQLKGGMVYLDSAATTLKPQSVVDRLSHFYLEEYATIHRSVYEGAQKAGAEYYQTRLSIQKFIGAVYPEEVLITRGTTHSLNLLASSFCATFLQKGDAIIISEIEHHSNVIPWQWAALRHGGKLLYVRVEESGEIDLVHLSQLLKENRVRLISLAHVSNITGSVQPIKKIIDMAHAASAYVAIDGAQAIAHKEINVADMDADFYAFSSHKLYGPTGVGVLYGKRALLEKMVPYEGGGDMVDLVRQEKSSYAPLPHKFEPGTPPIAEVIGFGAALDFVNQVGLKKIEAHEGELREYARKRLEALGVRFLGYSNSSLLTFTLKGLHALDAAHLLDCKKIAVRSGHLCSQLAMSRFGVQEALRISFGLYTSKQEIDYFVDSLISML